MGFSWKIVGRTMEFNEKDTELISLLAVIKNADGEYPEDLLAPRRQRFMKQMAEIGGFAGLGMGLKSSSSGASSMPPIASSLIETVLVIAIVAEAGAVAFINRDKLTEIFRTVSKEPRVEEVNTAVNPVSIPIEIDPTFTLYLTPTVALTSTPTSLLSPTTESAKDATAENTPQITATPDLKDNNGNHYGQTPKPERTKDNGNDNKPKDKDPKKDPKPTKKPK